MRLLEFVQDTTVSYNIITQKFLESGHSFLPNDLDFGDIEKRLKHHSEGLHSAAILRCNQRSSVIIKTLRSG